MPPTLKKLIEDGEQQLAETEDIVEREELRSKLFNLICKKFPQIAGTIEIDGQLVEPVSRKDEEDAQIQAQWDREDNRNSSDFAEGGCYSNDDGDGEPRIRGLMVGPTVKDWGQTFRGATDEVLRSGLISHDQDEGNLRTSTDNVGQGQVYLEQVAEEMSLPVQSRPLTIRMWHGFAPDFRRAKPKADYKRVCLLCKEHFSGTENANWCDTCKSPKYAHMRRQLKAEIVKD